KQKHGQQNACKRTEKQFFHRNLETSVKTFCRRDIRPASTFFKRRGNAPCFIITQFVPFGHILETNLTSKKKRPLLPLLFKITGAYCAGLSMKSKQILPMEVTMQETVSSV